MKLEKFSSVDDYLHEVLSLQERLSAMAKAVSDEMLAYIMLIGLPAKYEPLRMTLESQKDALSSESVMEKISCFKFEKDNTESAMRVSHHQNNGQSGNNNRNQNSGNKKRNVICHYCKNTGHYKSAGN